jgi:hypothetical protein
MPCSPATREAGGPSSVSQIDVKQVERAGGLSSVSHIYVVRPGGEVVSCALVTGAPQSGTSARNLDRAAPVSVAPLSALPFPARVRRLLVNRHS